MDTYLMLAYVFHYTITTQSQEEYTRRYPHLLAKPVVNKIFVVHVFTYKVL